MRHESLYLNDILEAADHIAQFIAGVDFETFQSSEFTCAHSWDSHSYDSYEHKRPEAAAPDRLTHPAGCPTTRRAGGG